jgi:hypothetical protein
VTDAADDTLKLVDNGEEGGGEEGWRGGREGGGGRALHHDNEPSTLVEPCQMLSMALASPLLSPDTPPTNADAL